MGGLNLPIPRLSGVVLPGVRKAHLSGISMRARLGGVDLPRRTSEYLTLLARSLVEVPHLRLEVQNASDRARIAVRKDGHVNERAVTSVVLTEQIYRLEFGN